MGWIVKARIPSLRQRPASKRMGPRHRAPRRPIVQSRGVCSERRAYTSGVSVLRRDWISVCHFRRSRWGRWCESPGVVSRMYSYCEIMLTTRQALEYGKCAVHVSLFGVVSVFRSFVLPSGLLCRCFLKARLLRSRGFLGYRDLHSAGDVGDQDARRDRSRRRCRSCRG